MKKRPLIMGILNVTPDSFSDGGKFNTLQKALKHAKKLIKDGADILDIGGESTGPKSKNISLEEEIKRTIELIKRIRKFSKIPISIDTYKSEVAKLALEAGANIINDITALRGDKKMASIAAKYNCPIILMYSKDSSARTTIKEKNYKDVIKTVKFFLKKRTEYAQKNGIKRKNIIVDPGMGHYISAIPEYSLEIITRLNELKSLKYKMLIGISRKSFIGGKMEERDSKSSLLEAIAYLNGVGIIRTHNVLNSLRTWQKCN